MADPTPRPAAGIPAPGDGRRGIPSANGSSAMPAVPPAAPTPARSSGRHGRHGSDGALAERAHAATAPAAAVPPDGASRPRRARHRAAGAAERSSPPVRRIWLIAAGAALVAALALAAVGLTTGPRRDVGSMTSAGGSATTTATTGADPSGTDPAGTDLAAWAAAQLPAGTVLAADPALGTALEDAGIDPDRLVADDAATSDRPVLRVVRADEAAGAPTVARFGPADGSATLAVVDPAAVPPSPEQVASRARLGAAVLANPTTVAPASAAELLRAGRVDPRLLTLLAGMTARFGVQLDALPTAPGEDDGTLVRQAVIAGVGGRPFTDAAGAADLRTWLSAQEGPLAPRTVQPVDGGLLIGYGYVTDPDGVVTGSGG